MGQQLQNHQSQACPLALPGEKLENKVTGHQRQSQAPHTAAA
jgi:hypothetical protein